MPNKYAAGNGCRCCGKCKSGSICVAVTVCGVVRLGLTGVSISAIGPDGDTIGPCTPTSVGGKLQCCLSLTKKGQYTVTATAPCGSASTTVDALCGQTYNVTLNLPGGTITITQSPAPCNTGRLGGTLTGPLGYSAAISNVASQSFCVPTNGTYTATFNNSNGCLKPVTPKTITVSGCSGSLAVTLEGKEFDMLFEVFGCFGEPLEGATVTVTPITGSGGTSGVTDSSGQFTSTGLIGGCQYRYTITRENYEPEGPVDFFVNCFTGPDDWFGQLSPAEGLECLCCPEPVDPNFFITDSEGTHVLTRSVANPSLWVSDCIEKDNVDVSCVNGADNCLGPDPIPRTVAYQYLWNCTDNGDGTFSWALGRTFIVCAAESEPGSEEWRIIGTHCQSQFVIRPNDPPPECPPSSSIPGRLPFGDAILFSADNCGPDVHFTANLSFGFPDTAIVSN